MDVTSYTGPMLDRINLIGVAPRVGLQTSTIAGQ